MSAKKKPNDALCWDGWLNRRGNQDHKPGVSEETRRIEELLMVGKSPAVSAMSAICFYPQGVGPGLFNRNRSGVT